ncbi:MAG: FmdB family zinc ribbon protein [Candidatus Binatia bacterium]
MPIYEYECPKCGTFEISQKITDAPLRRCPTCKAKISKLISQTSFQLKGSGWYVTDYASKGNGQSKDEGKGKDGGTKGEAAKSDSAKSDSAVGGGSKDSSSKTTASAA